MDMMASQITRLTIVYSTVYSGADQRKHQSSASLAFVREFFPFDNVIMIWMPWGGKWNKNYFLLLAEIINE